MLDNIFRAGVVNVRFVFSSVTQMTFRLPGLDPGSTLLALHA